MLFTGHYDYAIDAKSRLAIPAKIRGLLDPNRAGASFYAVIGGNGAIWLWPQRTFEHMAGDIEASLAPPRELMDFDAVTFPLAEHLEIDGVGRVRLPPAMLEAAGLGPKVVIAGVRDHLEIWDPDRWAEELTKLQAQRSRIIERARPLLGRGSPGGSEPTPEKDDS